MLGELPVTSSERGTVLKVGLVEDAPSLESERFDVWRARVFSRVRRHVTL